MFEVKKDRHISQGIKEKIGPLQYLLLWQLIDDMEVEKDSVQVFVLRKKFCRKGLQEVEHTQKNPVYKNIFRYYTTNPVNAEIHVIDKDERSIMILAEEY